MNPEESYKYCPRCGNLFPEVQEYPECNFCGLKFYINPAPCALVLIYKKSNPSEVLFTRRAFDPGKSLLDLPGGFVEKNETFEESIFRETEEELGIKIDTNKLVYLDSFYDRYLFQDINQYIITVNYVYEAEEDINFEPHDDVTECEFLNINKIKDDELSFIALREVLDDYKSKFLK